jgi:hypothetical protein
MSDNSIAWEMSETVGEVKAECRKEVHVQRHSQMFDRVRDIVTLLSLATILAFAFYYRAELQFLLCSKPTL